MTRRATTGGKTNKARRSSTPKPKRRTLRNTGALYADLKELLDQRTRERDEALEQQSATSEVLKVISSSPGDLEPVFQSMLVNAVRICGAKFGNLVLFDGKNFSAAAFHNMPTAYADALREQPVLERRPGDGLSSVLKTKSVVQIADVAAEPAYRGFRLTTLAGARTLVVVPMLKNNELVGAVNIYRTEVKAFTEKQIELVTNFAAQAVIAIENTRLLNELRQRTDDLTESLEQQTATSEVLKVISRSPGDLEPVFRTMLESAIRICDAKFGVMHRYDGTAFHPLGGVNEPVELVEYRKQRGPFVPTTGNDLLTRVFREKATIHVADDQLSPMPSPPAKFGNARTTLVVPMLKENDFVGVILIYRQEVRPFSPKQIELVQNFAAQAVIAIENTRLLNELRQRTDDLAESLEQQTATSEVLKVISSSPGELKPVFDAMLESATRLCDAKFGVLLRASDGKVQAVSIYNLPKEAAEFITRRGAFFPIPGGVLHRLIEDSSKPIQSEVVQDMLGARTIRLAGGRMLVAVPMRKGASLVGAIVIYREEVRPFTNKQVELVSNFAAQAVIAIENARLLNELRQRTHDLTESLEQQTATSEVLKVISSSPGELEPVFQSMLTNAARICEANFGVLFQFEHGAFRAVALHGAAPPAFVETRRRNPIMQPVPGTALGRLLEAKKTVQISDARAEPAYSSSASHSAGIQTGEIRTVLSVPMLKEDELVGAFNLCRHEVRQFTDREVELVSNFAAQAVIAIENTRLLSDLREALQRQTATSDVLGVISSSPGELAPVFNTMLENATRICDAKFGSLVLFEGNNYRRVALYNAPAAYINAMGQNPVVPMSAALHLSRLIHSKQVLHVDDMLADDPNAGIATLGGARTTIVVPIMREGEVVGAISVFRQEVRPFTDKQIDLVRNFAAQAVIAIENARLLNELRQRTDDLTESLEQQTATSEVLKVISSSPGNLQPVFESMLTNAIRLCEARFGILWLFDGDVVRLGAMHGVPEVFADVLLKRGAVPAPAPAGSPLRRILDAGDVIHTADEMAEPLPGLAARYGGARSLVGVPMRKDDKIIGAFIIYRQEVRPFTDKQIELVKNFAAQAVIAIENTRLLSELRESLQQQTATADVLRVISSSPGALEPVFNALLENAVRICGANFGNLYLYSEGGLTLAAAHNTPHALVEVRRRGPFKPLPDTPLGQAMLSRQTAQVADLSTTRAYIERDPVAVAAVELGGNRTVVAVPMVKDNELVGIIAIYRQEVRPFDDKQVELLKSFAAQAVIAIENARLLNELRESLQQQTATADVLKVISRSAFDLVSVLDTLLQSAANLCDADQGTITQRKGDQFYRSVVYGFPPAFLEFVKDHPVEPGRDTGNGRALLEGKVIHIPDVEADPDYTWKEAQRLGGYRTLLGVPMLRDGIPVGVLTLTRTQVRPFTDKELALVSTFADQAAIAIENVRLFDEIQDKSRQLAEASQHKSQFLANMSHELRTPLNAILGYTELISDGVYGAPPEKMLGVLKRVESNGKHLLGLINAVLDLSKIEAGQLVLDLADYSLKDVVQTVCAAVEALAADKRLALKAEVSADLPPAHGDERRLTQVLLNLMGNAIKFTDSGEVIVKASSTDGAFNVSVRDTGPGISAADQAKLFQEFQQADNSITRKKGGTGLGLAISKRIIEMHGGRIWVESDVGKGSVFSFSVPVIAKKLGTNDEQMHSGGRGPAG